MQYAKEIPDIEKLISTNQTRTVANDLRISN